MRRFISMMLTLVLVCLAGGAYAETTFSMAGYDHEDTGHDWTTNLFFQRMEERSGIHMELTQYKTADAWKAAKESMLSGETALPDALFKADFTPQETMKWFEAGKIIDLKPYLEQYAPNLWAMLSSNPEWMEAVTLPTGEIAALPAIDELQFTNAMWINQTWLNRAGLIMPTTAEELTEVLRVFKSRDMNGNGKSNDEIPLTFSSLWDLRFLGHAFGINANDYHVTIDENGVVSEVLTSDANRTLLTWLNQLWEEGLLDSTGFSGLRDLSASTSSSSDQDQEVVYGVMFASTPVSLVSNSAMKEYAVLDPLVYEGEQIYRDLTGDIIRGTFVITSACKDPAALLSWVDYLYTEEGFILSEAGVADEEFYWNDDGTWLWDSASDSMISSVLTENTIRSGSSMPGYSSIPFQQKIDDASTQFIVNSLLRLKGFDEMPYPLVYLTQEQQSRVDELIWNIGKYAEYQMVWFVAGDVELNDDSWQDFCAKVKELGIDELVSIWQTAADNQR